MVYTTVLSRASAYADKLRPRQATSPCHCFLFDHQFVFDGNLDNVSVCSHSPTYAVFCNHVSIKYADPLENHLLLCKLSLRRRAFLLLVTSLSHKDGPPAKLALLSYGGVATSMAQDGDVWTTIPSKKNRKNRNNAEPAPAIPPLSRDMSVSKIHADVRTSTHMWRQSTARKQLLSTLHRLKPDQGWSVKKAVCLGSGSFSRDNMESRRRSIVQFAMFLDLVGTLGVGPKGVWVQEPRYTEVDRSWLESQGYRVLEYEEGAGLGAAGEYCGAETLVCELFIEHDVRTIEGLFGRDNGLVVSTARRHLNTNEALIRKLSGEQKTALDSLLSRYRAVYFPHFEEDPQVFEGLEVLAPALEEDD